MRPWRRVWQSDGALGLRMPLCLATGRLGYAPDIRGGRAPLVGWVDHLQALCTGCRRAGWQSKTSRHVRLVLARALRAGGGAAVFGGTFVPAGTHDGAQARPRLTVDVSTGLDQHVRPSTASSTPTASVPPSTPTPPPISAHFYAQAEASCFRLIGCHRKSPVSVAPASGISTWISKQCHRTSHAVGKTDLARSLGCDSSRYPPSPSVDRPSRSPRPPLFLR
jgi:hypothetical protein